MEKHHQTWITEMRVRDDLTGQLAWAVVELVLTAATPLFNGGQTKYRPACVSEAYKLCSRGMLFAASLENTCSAIPQMLWSHCGVFCRFWGSQGQGDKACILGQSPQGQRPEITKFKCVDFRLFIFKMAWILPSSSSRWKVKSEQRKAAGLDARPDARAPVG